jgi:hypothetical protein
MRYLFEGMSSDASASSSEKEKCGVGGSRMGTKGNEIAKAGRPCSWECYERKLKRTVIWIFFFIEILINVKASRVN